MKQLRTTIAAFADACGRLGAEGAEARLCILLPAVATARDMTLAQWRAKAEMMDVLEPGGAPQVEDVVADLRLLERLMRATASDRAREKLGAFITILERQRAASLKEFAEAIRSVCRDEPCAFVEPRRMEGESKVAAYARRLRETAGDPTVFERVLELMGADPDMRREDIIDVAGRFATPIAKSTSKKLALVRISEQRGPVGSAAALAERPARRMFVA